MYYYYFLLKDEEIEVQRGLLIFSNITLLNDADTGFESRLLLTSTLSCGWISKIEFSVDY